MLSLIALAVLTPVRPLQTSAGPSIFARSYKPASGAKKAEMKPVVNKVNESRVVRVATRRKKRTERIESVIKETASAPRPAPKPNVFPATITLTCNVKRDDQRPLADFKGLTYRLYEVDRTGTARPLASAKPAEVRADGTFEIRGILSQPSYVEFSLSGDDDAEWDFAQEDAATYSVRSDLTGPKNAPPRGYQHDLVLQREVFDFELRGVPDGAKVMNGDDPIATTPSGGVAKFTLPSEIATSGASQYAIFVSTTGPVSRTASATFETRSLSKYEPNVIKVADDAWKISALPSLEVGSLELMNQFGSLKYDSTNAAANNKLFSPEAMLEEPLATMKLGRDPKRTPEDGATWLEYPGIRLRSREVQASGKTAKYIERIELTAPEGGSVGGVMVGDSKEALDAAFGPPEELGDERPYLKGGIVFSLANGKVAKISLKRPIPLIMNGLEPQRIPRGTRMYIDRQNSGSSDGEFGADSFLAAKLARLGGYEMVSSRDQADIVLEWSWRGMNLSRGSVRYLNGLIPVVDRPAEVVLGIDLEIGTFTGDDGQRLSSLQSIDRRTLTAQGKSDTVSGSESIDAIAVRRARETLNLDMLKFLTGAVPYGARVSDIDYKSGMITIEVGWRLGIKAGDEFEIVNIDTPAWTAIPEIKKAKADGEGRARDHKNVAVVARVSRVGEDSCYCSIEGLTRTGQQAQGTYETPLSLPADLKAKLAQQILDPATGVVFARYRFRDMAAAQ